jgi:hypothetical protein
MHGPKCKKATLKIHTQYMFRGKRIVIRWYMLLISQTLLNPMYEYVAAAVKFRVQHIAFRTVCGQTTDIASEAVTNIPKLACNETNLMHYVSLVYPYTLRLHVMGLLVAQVTMYIQ